MSEQRDPTLTRLFARESQELDAAAFLQSLRSRIEREEHRLRMRSTLTIGAILLVALVAIGLVSWFVAEWTQVATQISSGLATLLLATLSGSIIIAAIPLVLVWQGDRLKRLAYTMRYQMLTAFGRS
jgi:hypothetical protein